MFITDKPIDLNEFLIRVPDEECGASAHFIGWVRNHHDGRKVTNLFYDCYRPLAEKEMAAIIREVAAQSGADEIRAIHRIGLLKVGEAAVAVWVSAPHREEAFLACRRTIDEIKKRVPIWKKEFYEDGNSEWVLCTHEKVLS